MASPQIQTNNQKHLLFAGEEEIQNLGKMGLQDGR
jgi:hypothetical protein